MGSVIQFPARGVYDAVRHECKLQQELQQRDLAIITYRARVTDIEFHGPTRRRRYNVWLTSVARTHLPNAHPLRMAEFGSLHPETNRERDICDAFWKFYYEELLQRVACEQLMILKLQKQIFALPFSGRYQQEVISRSGLRDAILDRESWLRLVKDAGRAV